MSRTSWFQNSVWSEAAEKHFREKLQRARDKAQPLRIQASCLRRTRPDVSLRLLEEYFSLPHRFQDSEAYHHRAEALLALDRVPEAIDAFFQAIACESDRGATQTEARRDFAFLIATRKLKEHYTRALSVLGDGTGLLFPVQRFTHHASIALISADSGDLRRAREHAAEALKAAAATTSGLPHHADLGLVGDDFDHAKRTLATILTTAPGD